MKCPLCSYESDSKDFRIYQKVEDQEEIQEDWFIIAFHTKRFRICLKCGKDFKTGTPVLIRKEYEIKEIVFLSKKLAQKAQLLKKKRKIFTITRIQKLFNIPLPQNAELLLLSLVKSGLMRIIEYPPKPKKIRPKKFEFVSNAEELIQIAIDGKTLEQQFLEKNQKIQKILDNFHKTPSKVQSIFIHDLIFQQKTNLCFIDKNTGSEICPHKRFTKYETILSILLGLFDILESNKILTTKQFCSVIKIEMDDLNRVKRSLVSLLENKLLFFGVIGSRNELYIEPIPIPQEIIEEIKKIEIDLRKFIIEKLLKKYTSINNSFENGISLRIQREGYQFNKNRTLKKLKDVLEHNANFNHGKDLILLNEYNHNGVCSFDLFHMFLQQTTFFDLINFLQDQWNQVFSLFFTPYSFNTIKLDLLLTKEGRNIDSHRKYKLINIHDLIEALYKITTKIN